MLWCKWRLFIILFMILHEFSNVLLKYSKNSHWNNDCWNHLPFLMMHHTRKIWLGSRTTASPFWMKIHEWKVWQGGHTTLFPFSIKILISCWGRTTLVLFLDGFSIFVLWDKYHATCFFQAIKGRSTQAKCKQNVRNMQETCKIIQPMITHLWHLSPLLLWDWEWCSLCKINEYTYCKSNLKKTDFYNIGKNIRLLVLSPLISTLSIKLNKGNNDARWIQFSDNKYSQRKARSL